MPKFVLKNKSVHGVIYGQKGEALNDPLLALTPFSKINLYDYSKDVADTLVSAGFIHITPSLISSYVCEWMPEELEHQTLHRISFLYKRLGNRCNSKVEITKRLAEEMAYPVLEEFSIFLALKAKDDLLISNAQTLVFSTLVSRPHTNKLMKEVLLKTILRAVENIDNSIDY